MSFFFLFSLYTGIPIYGYISDSDTQGHIDSDKNGITLRAHLEQVAKATGRVPPELADAPPFPDRFARLWEMFIELHSGRSYGMNGPDALSWSDIHAWNTLTRSGLKDWEVRVIKSLDLLWLRIMREDETQ